MKKILVKKFGGTSIGHPERLRSIVDIIKNSRTDSFPIVVVSAISGQTKSLGSTTLLLKALENAEHDIDFESELHSIFSQHQTVVTGVVGASGEAVLEMIEAELEQVRKFLSAIRIIKEASPRSLDYILSVGERLSAMLVSQVLTILGVKSTAVDLSHVLNVPFNADTDEIYREASVAFKRFLERLVVFDESYQIPVVTGFFGPLPKGMMDTVGRGYTDLTSALIARGFGREKVSEVQIWKEVDGVFSSDPRKVESAKVLANISPLEASELTYFGSEVIHPYTMEQVIAGGMPIRVLNSLKPELPGTLIKDSSHVIPGVPTAVTAKGGISVVSITSTKMFYARGFLARLFGVLRDFGVVVDLVSTSEITVSWTIDDLAALDKAIPKLREFGELEILRNRAIVAVVGEGLKGSSKIVSKMLLSLSDAGIEPDIITQASSQVSVSCVVKEEDSERAVKAVHAALFQNQSTQPARGT
jgi:aspartate kinase